MTNTTPIAEKKLSNDEEYLAEVVWSFPYSGKSPIIIKGSCMEDAVNKFYQFGGGEIIHIYEKH